MSLIGMKSVGNKLLTNMDKQLQLFPMYFKTIESICCCAGFSENQGYNQVEGLEKACSSASDSAVVSG